MDHKLRPQSDQTMLNGPQTPSPRDQKHAKKQRFPKLNTSRFCRHIDIFTMCLYFCRHKSRVLYSYFWRCAHSLFAHITKKRYEALERLNDYLTLVLAGGTLPETEEQEEGEIRVSSTEGVGTTFEIRFYKTII